MADRHRAEVVITEAQNSATAKALDVFSDGREAPPEGRCNRRAKRRIGKVSFGSTWMSARNRPKHSDCAGIEPPGCYIQGNSDVAGANLPGSPHG